MSNRASTVPNLDLSSWKTESKKEKVSSPVTLGDHSSDGLSPLTPRSPKSASSSPLFKGATIRPVAQDSDSKATSPTLALSPGTGPAEPTTPGITAIPQHFPSPKDSRHTRDASKSFFGNLKAPKSSHKSQRSDSSENSTEHPKSRGSSRERKTPIASKQYESTPDLPGALARATGNERTSWFPSSTMWIISNKITTDGLSGQNNSQQTGTKKVATDLESAIPKKNKQRFANLLTRSRSIRVDDSSGPRPPRRRPSTGLAKLEEFSQSATTAANPPRCATATAAAPARPERSIQGGLRPPERHTDTMSLRKERSHGSMVASGSLSQVSGASATIFSNLKSSSSGTADRIGKAGKGFFSKITRSGSTNEREMITDDSYTCSVINLPLIEQARKTRIAKKLEDCRDKTEFWMPALPYRSIDYLNFKGCEEEGLYRVPGSGREVKHWQRRFDTELDIDLFDVPDLYDINTVGSLFKAWLRELPDELFPKSTQTMIAMKCEGATTAPQLLKDELSKLPPYHYYLLFAITCHLNLLHSYVDQNKMDYRNLCICFQPCMKIDAFCFQFLVCDWKNCWQGCWTEKEYLEIEKKMDARDLRVSIEQEAFKAKERASASHERAISSSSSSAGEESRQPSRQPSREPPRPATSRPATTRPQIALPEPARPATARTRKAPPKNIETSHNRSISQLPELGPPLSPIKI
ncbi:Rho GTPase activation protein [Penicillium expansum]|uniref:Rho GTPase activation protein n=1 Tax=Penicillium expansum TaxID=27334 RepID=A0A0A2JPX7_PENEN|nr:Rho GTPase activation protein [Penicillium expansum]KGO41899.1 Rho GTPase activation protein [Penicillium expansum]KGO56648.1 Rho GTPase activation protein [Penicillium expansum]KGO72018.1 Rho GTPase activation protein [Penicillium expansum]